MHMRALYTFGLLDARCVESLRIHSSHVQVRCEITANKKSISWYDMPGMVWCFSSLSEVKDCWGTSVLQSLHDTITNHHLCVVAWLVHCSLSYPQTLTYCVALRNTLRLWTLPLVSIRYFVHRHWHSVSRTYPGLQNFEFVLSVIFSPFMAPNVNVVDELRMLPTIASTL